MSTSVLLVDDHEVVRKGIRSLLALTDDFEVVGEAAGGAEAIERARDLAPDLIVIDLMMPDVDGVEAIRAIKKLSPRSAIAVLTSTDQDDLAFAAIEAGAQSLLFKSMLGDELLATLRRIAAGEAVIHPFVAQRILKAMRRKREPREDPFASLTERELDVLRKLAEGGSNARIAAALNIGEKTVKSHLGNVLAKLHLADRTEAVAFAWRRGLMSGERDDD
ncbi:two component transcriptional regulator, LuxR family [Lysobacter sp. yr284]|uniref:response regulator n=1 Tax=Lysobacter TaxID=68 RepID=UPI00089A886E|nr:response regulator transcription factor [Lysobacter sp. yr284]SDZ16656.1 two component transcriptional regulator, LuxR family [Lysobacter sp. yr284]